MYSATIYWAETGDSSDFVVMEHNYVGEWVVLVFRDRSTKAFPARNISRVDTAEVDTVRAV